MVRHERTTTTWESKRGNRKEKHLILGHVALNPNAYSGAMESVRVVVGEDLNKESLPMFVDIRNWVESDKYTGPGRRGGLRLDRHHLIELLAMLPEVKKAMDIGEDEILNEIDERKEALDKQKEK